MHLFSDGFEGGTLAAGGWTGNAQVRTDTNKTGDYGAWVWSSLTLAADGTFEFDSSGGYYLCLSFWIYRDQAAAHNIVTFGQDDNNNTAMARNMITLRAIDAAGNLSLYMGATAFATTTTLATTTDAPIPAQTWTHVAIGWLPDNASGVAQVYINNALHPELDVSGDTLNGTSGDDGAIYNKLQFSGPSNWARYDDVVLWDTQTDGNDPMNAWPMGVMELEKLAPTADTADADFTPSTGSDHYALIDEVPASDADYNESATLGHRDICTLSDQTLVGTPLAVNLHTRLLSDDGGAKSVSPILDGTSTDVATAAAITGTAAHRIDRYGTDTDGSAWDETAVNALGAGYEVAS